MIAGKFGSSRWLLHFCIALLAITVTPTNAVVADDEILECAKIEDDSQRLSCFDAIAEDRQHRAESGMIPVPPAQQSDRHAAPPVPPGQQAASEDLALEARVNRCEEAPDGRYYFYLDNGEVWKQTKSDRHRYRDCSFSITITKDWFGHKMLIGDDEKTVRIKRIR